MAVKKWTDSGKQTTKNSEEKRDHKSRALHRKQLTSEVWVTRRRFSWKSSQIETETKRVVRKNEISKLYKENSTLLSSLLLSPREWPSKESTFGFAPTSLSLDHRLQPTKKKKTTERENLDVSPRLEIVVRLIIADSLEKILGDPWRLLKQTMIWQILFSSSVVAEE